MFEKYFPTVIYLIILGFITWLSARRKDPKDFLYASHNMGWKPLTLSFFASLFSSYNVVVSITFSFLFGPYILIPYFGALGGFLAVYFLAKKYKDSVFREDFNNVIDFIKNKFDLKVANLLNLSLIVVLFLFITLQFFINNTLFSQFLGWNKYLSALFIGGIVFIYTNIGGLKADVFTDVFQGILMLIIVALVFMVDTSKITSETILPILSDKTILYGALSIAFAQFLLLIVQPELWQRVVASRSLKDLKIGIVLSWILLMIIWVPMTMIGLAARASGLAKDPSTIFYDILQTTAPGWFFPFLIVSLFAAFMSTLDSSLFAISSQLGKYGFLVKREETKPPTPSDERKTVKKIRVSMTIVLILALIASLFFANFLKGVFGLISLMTVLAVALVMALLLKISSNETFIAILLSILAFIFAFFGGYITDEKPVTTLYPSFFIFGYILLQRIALKIYKLYAKTS